MRRESYKSQSGFNLFNCKALHYFLPESRSSGMCSEGVRGVGPISGGPAAPRRALTLTNGFFERRALPCQPESLIISEGYGLSLLLFPAIAAFSATLLESIKTLGREFTRLF